MPRAIKAVGIIPARWKSTRFPGKPLHLIAGKPLLRRVWERCRRARTLDAVIIATDDQRIAEAGRKWGAEVVMTSARHKSGTDRIAEVAGKRLHCSIVVNIQGDEPLIEPRLIDRLVKKLRSDQTIGMVTAGHPFQKAADMASPHQVKVMVDADGAAIDFTRKPPARVSFCTAGLQTGRSSRRRSLHPRVLRHQGIYAFRRDTLLQFVKWKQTGREKSESLEQLRALENGVKVHVLVTKHGSPGIDTPADARALERQLARVQGSVTEWLCLPRPRVREHFRSGNARRRRGAKPQTNTATERRGHKHR
jgi:3-deoxy-manno-octulosonate cytidylyltransferase (CMP-KDO synthetase)